VLDAAPAVDGDDLPRDVGRVPGEEQRRAGDILGAAVTLQGGLADDLALRIRPRRSARLGTAAWARNRGACKLVPMRSFHCARVISPIRVGAKLEALLINTSSPPNARTAALTRFPGASALNRSPRCTAAVPERARLSSCASSAAARSED